MERKRDDGGKFAEEVSLDTVMEVFDQAEIPVLSTTEVAEALDCSRASAYNKLEALVEEGDLRKKKVGAKASVYIRWDG